MDKIVTIGDKEIKLNNNIAWCMEYRDQFGKDILPVLMPLLTSMLESVSTVIAEAENDGYELTVPGIAEAISGRSLDVVLPLYQAEFVDLVINTTWAMAKVADPNIDPPKQWVRQFDGFYLDVLIPELLDLILKGSISSKNLERLETLKARLQPGT